MVLGTLRLSQLLLEVQLEIFLALAISFCQGTLDQVPDRKNGSLRLNVPISTLS
jgi:hypothetical protein